MPKELIVSRECRQFDTVVTWSREASYVQVGTLMAPPETSESPQNLKALVATWTEDDYPYPLSSGLYNTLSRYEINELIRVLRRARDQAFGRDE